MGSSIPIISSQYVLTIRKARHVYQQTRIVCDDHYSAIVCHYLTVILIFKYLPQWLEFVSYFEKPKLEVVVYAVLKGAHLPQVVVLYDVVDESIYKILVDNDP